MPQSFWHWSTTWVVEPWICMCKCLYFKSYTSRLLGAGYPSSHCTLHPMPLFNHKMAVTWIVYMFNFLPVMKENRQLTWCLCMISFICDKGRNVNNLRYRSITESGNLKKYWGGGKNGKQQSITFDITYQNKVQITNMHNKKFIDVGFLLPPYVSPPHAICTVQN